MRRNFTLASAAGLFPDQADERASCAAVVGARMGLLWFQVVKSVGPSRETAIRTGAPRSTALSVMQEPCEWPHISTWDALAAGSAVTAASRLRKASYKALLNTL